MNQSNSIRRPQLFHAMTDAATATDRSASAFDKPSLPSAGETRKCETAGARILLAEDHEISREVAITILTHAGFRCQAVSTGDNAVAAAAREEFDLILMDCQMPNMDGFEATRAIRKAEQARIAPGNQARRIPIVALTGSAINGDRRRCLEAGMDDYISKPLDPAELVEVIRLQLAPPTAVGSGPPRSQPECSPETDPQRSVDAPFDTHTLLRRWGSDGEIIRKFIPLFKEQARVDIERIEQAVQAVDSAQTAHIAHALKGASACFCAARLEKLAAEMEVIGRAGDLRRAKSCIDDLRRELARALDFQIKLEPAPSE